MKIVINRCFGGFSLSDAACQILDCGPYDYSYPPDMTERANPKLVACVELLDDAASGDHAKLKVVTIPDDVEWEITEYDGMETIEEKHRKWC